MCLLALVCRSVHLLPVIKITRIGTDVDKKNLCVCSFVISTGRPRLIVEVIQMKEMILGFIGLCNACGLVSFQLMLSG